jgi:hypothetical protein
MAGRISYYGGIVKDGLILNLDAAKKDSYPGSGANLYDISGNSVTSTLAGTYSFTSTANVSCIRLTNSSSNRLSNISRINCSSITTVTTVSMWYYQHSGPATRYLLDARTGGANAYINDGNGFGTDWATGALYKNGISLAVSWTNVETIGSWQNIVVIANAPMTDDINLFSRYSNDEGLDVSFSIVHIYNRALSAAEIQQNYNALKSRFGL